MSSAPLPILSLSDFHSPSTRQTFTTALLHSLQTRGAVYLTDTFPPKTLTSAFSTLSHLFSLPPSTLDLAAHPPNPLHHRGYSSLSRESVSSYNLPPSPSPSPSTESIKDQHSSFDLGSPLNSQQPNLWLPSHVFPEFRPWAEDFFSRCYAFAEELLVAMALGLGETETGAAELVSAHEGGWNCQLRLLHYPPLQRGTGGLTRMAGHCDWSTMTMLFQDGVGGLEIEDLSRPGEFVPVPPVEGACVVTVGDMMMRWSNGRMKSTLHRVGLPSAEGMNGKEEKIGERFSIPFFISPHPETVVRCLPSCVDDEHPVAYEPVTQIAYNKMKMGLQYADQ